MEIRRGDYKLFEFQRNDKNNVVIQSKPEKMFFTVKENVYTEKALIQKTLTKNGGITFDEETFTYYLEILPEDTNNLFYTKYVYDIEIINNGKPKTISIGDFIIKEEVTFASNEVGYNEE